VTLAAAVTNLKRIILACGDRKVIIITPGPRYLSQQYCCTAGHCIHLLVPESSLKMIADLAHLHLFIQRRLSSSSNCKKGASLEEALAAFSTWGTVHGSGSEAGHPIPALTSFRTSSRPPNLRGFTRGGSRGSG
jgi:hypothetical protein